MVEDIVACATGEYAPATSVSEIYRSSEGTGMCAVVDKPT